MFGDLTVSPKLLLCEDCGLAAAIGVTFDFPTAPNAELTVPPLSILTKVMDDSVHVEPFVGLQRSRCDPFFSIAYLQLDMDANGDRVFDQHGVPSLEQPAGSVRRRCCTPTFPSAIGCSTTRRAIAPRDTI